MKTCHSILLASLLFCGLCADASATNFSGKFDVVQSGGSGGTTTMRYYSYASKLSIFASNDTNGALLQDAYFHKAAADIVYTPIVCPSGYTGACGNLAWVSVSSASIP